MGNPLGIDVILYDGNNAAAIADFIQLEVGDGFVFIDGKPILFKASTLDEIRDTMITTAWQASTTSLHRTERRT